MHSQVPFTLFHTVICNVLQTGTSSWFLPSAVQLEIRYVETKLCPIWYMRPVHEKFAAANNAVKIREYFLFFKITSLLFISHSFMLYSVYVEHTVESMMPVFQPRKEYTFIQGYSLIKLSHMRILVWEEKLNLNTYPY